LTFGLNIFSKKKKKKKKKKKEMRVDKMYILRAICGMKAERGDKIPVYTIKPGNSLVEEDC
jgi:hypothetical protein